MCKKTTQVDILARKEAERIAYYRLDTKLEAELWDDHWGSNVRSDLQPFYLPYLRGYLGYGQLRSVFLRHLPRMGLILEGGCGMAQHVVALRARGYNCFGVDFAPKTVERVKSLLPDLPVETGDICNLNLKSGSIDAYISLGVVEHFQEGPQTALKEAARVLKAKGLLLVSVPQAFKWRRLQALSENSELPKEAVFYQYAFSPSEFRGFVKNAGFRVIAEYGTGSHFALRIRYDLYRKLLTRFPRLAYMDLLLDRTPIGRDIARMRMYVAEKVG
ncbi:MAG: putative 3-demethylubiquinone-9 3-O-methyltransferase [Candidatus Brocadiaceae bacterium]|nr:putative 3-demethylubiquinone-9 3-O-methyltransferase [Candidatus Brocadiaceae bacterium]